MNFKKAFVFSFLLVLCHVSFSQIEYESGYFIDNSGQRVDCLIKDEGWNYNPYKFMYKLNNDAKAMEASIAEVKEFEIINRSKYIRADVHIDQSSEILEKLSPETKPDFKPETVFLKVLVEGEVSLFQFQRLSHNRFFYGIGDQGITQLVYKRYFKRDKIMHNNAFRNQLLGLNRDELPFSYIQNLEYTEKALTKAFIKISGMPGESVNVYGKLDNSIDLKVNLKVGLVMSDMNLVNVVTSDLTADMGSKLTQRIGMELELLIPYNRNKWSVLLAPNYSFLQNSEVKVNNSFRYPEVTSIVNYKVLDFSIGVQHYFFLSDNIKLFANASFNQPVLIFNSYVLSQTNLDEVDIIMSRNANFGIGVGLNLNDRLFTEIKYQLPRNLTNESNWDAKYQTTSFSLGYTLYNSKK